MRVHRKKVVPATLPPNAGREREQWTQGRNPGGLPGQSGVRRPRWRKPALAGVVGIALLLLVLLVACGSANNNSSTATAGNGSAHQQGSASATTVAASVTPQLVVPTSLSGTPGGTPGSRPLVITSPTPVQGGKPGSQQIVLADRILIINSVIRQQAPSTNSVLITLNLTVRNSSAKAIKNLPAYYQLMGSGDDIFGYQYNSSDTFYGSIAAHTTLDGMIVFEVPAAAASGLRLLYRPEVATETAIIPLQLA